MGTRVGDLSFVFLSYDEPNADRHWEELHAVVPHAQRIHGVKGINSAYRAAAEAAETERFLTIDGDCVIDPWFVDHYVDDDKINSRSVICWPARNDVNGLTYGNGGPKCWTRSMLRANTDPDHAHYDHVGMFGFLNEPRVMATVHPNGSALHAMRSGYREGVRLSSIGDKPSGLTSFVSALPPNTRRRLTIWCMLGADVSFGRWCIYGARLGCHDAQSGTFDRLLMADYDRFGEFFDQHTQDWSLESESAELSDPLLMLGDHLRSYGLDIVELDPDQSALFKELYTSDIEVSRFDILGQAYLQSGSMPVRPEKAFLNFYAGSLLNSSNAMNNLARCYRDGLGVGRDKAQAMNWVLNAAALGNEFALLRLGRSQAEGRDLPFDPKAAAYWFQRAVEAGSREAAAELESLLERYPEARAPIVDDIMSAGQDAPQDDQLGQGALRPHEDKED